MISSISPPSPLHTLFPHVKHSIFSLPCCYTPLCQIIIGFSTFRYQGFCFSDTIGHRGFFLFWTPLEAEGFFLFGNRRTLSFPFFGHRNFPFSDTEVFAFWKPSEAKVSPFLDTVGSQGFPFSDTIGNQCFSFFGSRGVCFKGCRRTPSFSFFRQKCVNL